MKRHDSDPNSGSRVGERQIPWGAGSMPKHFGVGFTHDGRHIIGTGRRFDPAADDARNLVTLFQRNANHPNMSSFERQVQATVRNGETVNFRAIPIYTDNNPMPTGVTLTARGSNGF